MASKKKIRRRVLGASCILAALIVAGASFAWFTSSDEVTNQLTATSDYGVSVVEDFTPPKDMTPGQEVNKDVAAVNTGSVGAFVRMSLDNSINMSVLSGTGVTDAEDVATNYYVDPVSGNITTTQPDGVTTEVYTLKDFKITLPNDTSKLVTLNAMETTDSNGKVTANEVTTLMAGGQVVVAEGKAVAPENQAVRSGDDVNNGYAIVYSAGGKKYVKESDQWFELVADNTTGAGVYKKAATAEATKPTGLTVDSLARDFSGNGQYQVQNNGLYLFRRTDNSGTKKYSGFYYNDGKFYKLATENNNNSTYVDATTITEDAKGVVNSIEGLKVLTLTDGINDATTGAAWSYKIGDLGANDVFTENADGNYIQAVYKQTTSTDPGVVFFIKLADGWRTSWDFVDGMEVTDKTAGSVGYFYYKDKLEAGQTSTKLIDSVKLSSAMTNRDFFDLTYDLKVKLDTVQVTKDDQGNETATAVGNGWATPTLNETNGVIDSVAWSAAPVGP